MQPAEQLKGIITAIDAIITEGNLTQQQLTFIRHIRKTSESLYLKTLDIPQTELALKRILPTLGANFIQQLTVIFGYARMLLEMPASFDGANLSPSQSQIMQVIYETSFALFQSCETIQKTAFSERQSQRNYEARVHKLNELIVNYLPILHYFLQDKAVQLDCVLPQDFQVLVNPYHLTATLEHIILTIANELVEYGQIKVSSQLENGFVDLRIFCTGIALSNEEIAILFEKQGRQLYRRRFEEQAGRIQFSREAGHGATVHLLIPIA